MYSEIVVLSHKTGNRSRTYTYQNGNLNTFPGQLVRVPFGNNSFFGIIVSHSTKTNVPFTKPITEVYGNIPLITKDQLKFFVTLADHYYGYLSDILKLALPAIPIRQLQQLKRPLSTNLSKTELIIVPSDSQIPKIVAGIGTADITIIDSKDTPTNKFIKYLKILSGQSTIVIGTRSAILLPIKNLSKITIYFEEDIAYQEERAPYYNTVKAADIYIKLFPKTQLELISTSPSLASFYRRRKNLKITPLVRPTNLKIISLRNQQGSSSGSSLLSDIAISRINHYLMQKKSILLFLNRTSPKGFFTCLSCQNKQFLSGPQENCPNCHSYDIRFFSPNLTTLQAEIAKLFVNHKTSTLSSNTRPDFTTDIFLATKSALYLSPPEKLGLIVAINTDDLFYPYNFNSEISGFQTLRKLVSISAQEVILQSKNPDNPQIDQSLVANPQEFLTNQLEMRKSFNLPPLNNCLHIFIEGKNLSQLQKKSRKIIKIINQFEKIFTIGETFSTKKTSTGLFTISTPVFAPNSETFDIITAKLPSNIITKLNYSDTL